MKKYFTPLPLDKKRRGSKLSAIGLFHNGRIIKTYNIIYENGFKVKSLLCNYIITIIHLRFNEHKTGY